MIAVNKITKGGHMNKKQIYRHGEVLLIQVKDLPEGKKTQHKSFIVGHSETGHNHVLEGVFEVLEAEDSNLFFLLENPTSLVHKKTTDKHRTLEIKKGIYKRFHDTEYNPFTKLIESVKD